MTNLSSSIGLRRFPSIDTDMLDWSVSAAHDTRESAGSALHWPRMSASRVVPIVLVSSALITASSTLLAVRLLQHKVRCACLYQCDRAHSDSLHCQRPDTTPHARDHMYISPSRVADLCRRWLCSTTFASAHCTPRPIQLSNELARVGMSLPSVLRS